MLQTLELLALAIVLTACLSLLVAHAVTGAPTVSASPGEKADVIALLQQAGLPDGAVVYELGCGWGAQVIALARAFPEAQVRGIELSPLPWLVARLRTLGLPTVVVRHGNFLKADLSDAQAVVCYLMPPLMPKLAARLDHLLAPGTPVVALTFWFHDRQASASRNGPGLRGAAALYHWPAPRAA